MTAPDEAHAVGLSYLDRPGAGGGAIVLLHGIGSNARSFAPLMAELPAGSRVVAWDAPGYGRSEPLQTHAPTASDYAARLVGLLDHLGITRCTLLGHSLGTLTAARVAVEAPERVESLVLISPALGYAAAPGAPLPAVVAARVADLDRLGPEGFAQARAAGLVADPVARPDVLAAVRQSMAAVRRPGYDHAASLLAASWLLDDVARVHTPTLVLVGDRDRVTPPENARKVFDALTASGAQRAYQEIEGAAHAVCQEQPAAVARAVHTFMKDRIRAYA